MLLAPGCWLALWLARQGLCSKAGDRPCCQELAAGWPSGLRGDVYAVRRVTVHVASSWLQAGALTGKGKL